MSWSPTNDEIELAFFQPRCAVCNSPSATIRIVSRPDGIHVINSSPGGAGEDKILTTRLDAIVAAFTPPYEVERIKAAGWYDDAGFCLFCEHFYCTTHWDITSYGSGTCPEGHFKSLDPHWHPDFDDDDHDGWK